MLETCNFEVDVAGRDVEAFARLSGDHNPLHLDTAYAGTTEYGRPIVHGALLIGFVSRVLGMYIPGQRSLILSLKVQFPNPLFYPSRVGVSGRLKQFNSDRNTGTVHVDIVDLAKGWSVLQSEVSFAFHELGQSSSTGESLTRTETQADSVSIPASEARTGKRPRLLVTGMTGGIGSHALPHLAALYDLCCVTRKVSENSAGVEFHQVDLEEPGRWEKYLADQDPGQIYGVVHLSAPPVVQAFVSDDLVSVKRQWRHAIEVPLLIAQWARQPGSAVKRLVFLGSTAGSKQPQFHQGAYSLGKAAMEHLARLLTADLAAQGATINVVAPTVVPVGMHEGLTERARKTLVGKMPTGRMVDPKDIAAVIQFLLSDAAAQINGVVLAVDGGIVE